MAAVPGRSIPDRFSAQIGRVPSSAAERTALGCASVLGAVRRHVVRSAAAAVLFIPTNAFADYPLGYMRGYGTRTYAIADLLWGMTIISVLVVVVVTGLLLAGLLRRRIVAPQLPGRAPVVRAAGGLSWIVIGITISTGVLFGVAVWSVVTLADISNPPPGGATLTLEVTGHQWWWEIRYDDENPSRVFTTANEIHIPTGQPVIVKLVGADVIHSFWVPSLAGKTDAIPGQNNVTWLEAQNPGVYRGQCTEYCGEQHAHMAFQVIATTPETFNAWRDDQLKAAPPPRSDEEVNDQNVFIVKCGICHTVRGTRAGGSLGPDLSHLMSRTTIAAATLPNTPGYLSAWIADPQHVKPGNFMPRLEMSAGDLDHVRRFLETLQ